MLKGLRSVKLAAPPGMTGWVQVHEYTPDDPSKFFLKGQIFAVIASKNKSDSQKDLNCGREVITRIHEEYYGRENLAVEEALILTAKKIKKEFESIGIEFVIAVNHKDTLYAAGVNGSCLLVLRNGNLVTLLEADENITTVSGKILEKDIYALGSKVFFENFTHEELKDALIAEDFETSFGSFRTKIYSDNKYEPAGFFGVYFGKCDEDTEPQETPFLKENKEIILKKDKFGASFSPGKNTNLFVGAILVILLVISVFFGLMQKKNNDLKNTYGSLLDSAIEDFQKSQDIFGLDKTDARKLFISSNEKLNEVESSGLKDKRIDTLQNDLKSKEAEILGEVSVGQQQFLDLTLQTSGFNGSDLSLSDETIFILDKQNGQIVKTSVQGKDTSIVTSDEDIKNVIQIGSYEDTLYLLKGDGIYEVDDKEEEKQIEKQWNNPVFYLYSSNLYLLDRKENKIYRFPGKADDEGGGFLEKTEWLAPGIEADFSFVSDITIDGSIWILSSTGKVARFSMGSPQNVSIEEIPGKLNNPKKIYTNENLKNVYILDSENKRIVVLNKDGEFVVSYKNDEIGNAKDLVVSEEEKKIILLTGPNLISIGLRD